MKYKNVSFNSKLAAAKPVKQFIAEEKHHGLSEAELKDVHAKCVEEQKAKAKQEVPEQLAE